MLHPALLKSSHLINVGDISGAEKALVSIGDTEGDHALVSVLEDMAPKDLLAVIREFDASKESVINLVITPEQFARAVVLEAQYKDESHVRLQGMFNAVVHRDPNSAYDFLEAITEIEGGIDALSDYFTNHIEGVIQFTITGNFSNENYRGSHFEPDSIEWFLEKIEQIHEVFGSSESESSTTSIADDQWSDANSPDGPIFRAEITDGDWVKSKKSKPISRDEAADGDWKETAWILRYELHEAFQEVIGTLCNRKKSSFDLSANVLENIPVIEEESAI